MIINRGRFTPIPSTSPTNIAENITNAVIFCTLYSNAQLSANTTDY